MGLGADIHAGSQDLPRGFSFVVHKAEKRNRDLQNARLPVREPGECQRLEIPVSSSKALPPAPLELARHNVKCERGDSNPHAFRHQILSLARLPIPPLSRTCGFPLCNPMVPF
jgi:hypothetical protein